MRRRSGAPAAAREHLRRRRPAAQHRPDGRLDRRRGGREADRARAHLRRPPGRAPQLDAALRRPRDRARDRRRGRSIHTTIRLGLQRTRAERAGRGAGRRRGDQARATAPCSRSPGSRSPRPSRRAPRSRSSRSPPRCRTAWRRRRALSGADGRDAVRREAAQRGRRVVRRHPGQLVRALVQLRLRPARRQAGREEARGRRRALRLQRAAGHPRRQAQHDPEGDEGRLAVGSARSARTRDIATPLGMASWRRRSPTAACA